MGKTRLTTSNNSDLLKEFDIDINSDKYSIDPVRSSNTDTITGIKIIPK